MLNFYYVSSMYIGGSRTRVQMVWDTGSDRTVIQGYTCETCHLTYDWTHDKTAGSFTVDEDEFELTEVNYGSAKTTGFEARDTICLLPKLSTCVENESIFVVTEQEGFQKTYHGVQGLASGTNDNLVKSLVDKGVISKARFAFYLQNWQVGGSFLDIGTFDENKMSDPNDMVEIPVVLNDRWWTNYVTGFRLGDSMAETWGVAPKLAFTDSGTSCLFIDKDTFDFFISKLALHSKSGLSQTGDG